MQYFKGRRQAIKAWEPLVWVKGECSNPPFNAPNSFGEKTALSERRISVRIHANLVISVRSGGIVL
jgi:hypothetical protein